MAVGTVGDTGAHHGVLGQVVVGAPRDGVQLHEVLEVGDLPQDPFLERREREMGLGVEETGQTFPSTWQCPFLVPKLSLVLWPSLVPQLSLELWPCPPHSHPWFSSHLWSNGQPHPTAIPCSMAIPALRPSYVLWLSFVP